MCWYVKDSNLMDFMYQMGKDTEMLEEYKKDPMAVMDKAGLSEEEKAVLHTQDHQTILQALMGNFTEAS